MGCADTPISAVALMSNSTAPCKFCYAKVVLLQRMAALVKLRCSTGDYDECLLWAAMHIFRQGIDLKLGLGRIKSFINSANR